MKHLWCLMSIKSIETYGSAFRTRRAQRGTVIDWIIESSVYRVCPPAELETPPSQAGSPPNVAVDNYLDLGMSGFSSGVTDNRTAVRFFAGWQSANLLIACSYIPFGDRRFGVFGYTKDTRSLDALWALKGLTNVSLYGCKCSSQHHSK